MYQEQSRFRGCRQQDKGCTGNSRFRGCRHQGKGCTGHRVGSDSGECRQQDKGCSGNRVVFGGVGSRTRGVLGTVGSGGVDIRARGVPGIE